MSLLFLLMTLAAAVLLTVAYLMPRSSGRWVSLVGLGAVAAGVVWSFVTGDLGGPILLAGGLGLAWLHTWAQRDRRRMAMARFARDHGLDFRGKGGDALSEDFRLFGRGEGGVDRNVLHGTWRGMPVKVMDYEYHTTRGVWVLRPLERRRRFSVAVLELGASVPSIVAERNGAAGLTSDYMGFHDVQLKSDEFNRRYHVTADDREFAYQFFDARMLQWLLGQLDLLEAEVLGRKALVALSRLEPEDMARLLDAAVGFQLHIPRLVRRRYHLPDPVVP
jgi:hypothetical protein